MTKQRTWPTSRAVRAARGLWPDHNPLRRASDRAEAGMVALLVGAFLIGGPLIALIIWRLTFNSTFSSTEAEHAGWRQASAVLLSGEPNWNGGYSPSVQVRWDAPHGVRHTGQIFATPGARAGSTVTIWTDASGRLIGTPMSPRQAATQADFAAAIAVPIWALIVLCAGMLGHSALEHRRLAAWDADWRAANLSGPAGASPGL